MFKIGDKIVYPMHGAGIIDSVQTKEFLGEEKEYFILKMPIGNMDISIPKANINKMNIRDVISKKELKHYGVKFSIKKDLFSGNNIIFFQAKDEKVMEQAFKSTVNKFMNKDKGRESVIEKLNNFKEKVKASLDKDKVKHKHQEHSL